MSWPTNFYVSDATDIPDANRMLGSRKAVNNSPPELLEARMSIFWCRSEADLDSL